jgi:hypothetical protein
MRWFDLVWPGVPLPSIRSCPADPYSLYTSTLPKKRHFEDVSLEPTHGSWLLALLVKSLLDGITMNPAGK